MSTKELLQGKAIFNNELYFVGRGSGVRNTIFPSGEVEQEYKVA